MIDDKKIEEAARNYINKKGYFFKYYEEPCVDIEFAYREGYKEGCKDAINEFLASYRRKARKRKSIFISIFLLWFWFKSNI